MNNLTLSNLIGTLKATFKIGKATFDASGVATARNIVVPDKAGTLAMLSDVTGGGVTSLSVFTNAQAVISVDISSGYLPVLNRAGSTIEVALA
jgi:hypothetical protein